MKIFELLSKLKIKQFKPKIYTIVLANINQTRRMLWFGIAYSFDEAFEKSWTQAVKDFPDSPIWKPEMWLSSDIENLLLPFCDIEIKEKDENIQQTNKQEINKNDLIKRIITNNDTNLYKEKRDIFSENEKKFVEEELKNFLKGQNS